MGGYD